MIKLYIIITLAVSLTIAGRLSASNLGCIIEDNTQYKVTENDGNIVVARNNDVRNIELVIIRMLKDVEIKECK